MQDFNSFECYLCFSCLAEDPRERISAKAALEHNFFAEHELLPSLKDMVLLPTNVLRLLNVLDDPKYKNDDEIKGSKHERINTVSKMKNRFEKFS